MDPIENGDIPAIAMLLYQRDMEGSFPPRRQLSAGTDFGETYFKSVPDALLGRDWYNGVAT